jgi:outer membrane protein assembly factor BamB
VTDSTGTFSKITLQAPKSALPGTHYLTAVARANQAAAQTPFNVRTDWPQFGFTPGNARQNPYENVLDVNSVTGLDLRWTFPTAIAILSTPAVAGGVLYFGSEDGNLYALNATTGRKMWNYWAAFLTSSPAVAQGNVYFGSYDGNVYALNAKTGALVWSYATGQTVGASPTVSNGTVYIVTASDTLLALNATSGALVWSYGVSGIAQAAPSVANGALYVTGHDGFYSINASTGALIWNEPLVGMSSATAVAQGVVYANWADEFATEAVNTVTGNARWEGNFTTNSFALGGGTLYGGFNNGIYATGASSGTGGWSFPTSQPVIASPAVANGVVYAADYQGLVYAINATYGYELWSFQTGNFIYASPVVANGMLYVASVDHNLYAFGLPSGAAKIARPNPAELAPDMRLRIFNPALQTRE